MEDTSDMGIIIVYEVVRKDHIRETGGKCSKKSNI